MTLAAGDQLGSYEVIELIGMGGMGEVYRARDTRLHRDVAVKVLNDAHRVDPESLQRFEREALLLASLNHPNIATLHGLETSGDAQALVMELVDGETLADRLARAPRHTLPPTAALPIARQIAEALDAAHERGVVHRDLNPANIKIRSDGTLKVLDFGIAKVFDTDVAGHRGATVGVTAMQGAIIGTPSYMSPEQAAGGTVDRRTDVWAFGCVLYEMLAGQRAFEAETASATLARIIERAPDWGKLPTDLPPAIRLLLTQCLEKNPQKRRRDAGDVRLDLEHASAQPPPLPPAEAPAGSRRFWMVAAALLALATAGLVALKVAPKPSATTPEPVRFSLPAPLGGRFATSLLAGSGAPVGGSVSPDGRHVAFTARGPSGKIMLWVQALDSLHARELAGTEDAALPFWSPDSAAIGFFTQTGLLRINATGGPPQQLCAVTRGQGGTWGRNGTIVFAGNLRSALHRVRSIGGECARATTLAESDRAHRFPEFLPDGEHFLYHSNGARPEDSGVFIAALGAPDGRRLLAADSAAVHARPDWLLFVRRGTLFAQPFDSAGRKIAGEPVALAQSVPSEGSAPAFSASDTGILTYRSGPADSDEQQLVWLDRMGKRLEIVGPPGTYRGVDLSPDGTRIAAHDHKDNGGDIWVIEPRGTITRITFEPTQDNASPIWSPDGARIAFGSLRNGRWGLYHKAASGEGSEAVLIESEVPKIPAAWSPAGSDLVYWLYDAAHGSHQWRLPLTDNAATPVRLIDSPVFESHAQISPDGKWVAYMSDRNRQMEVYVRPFPSGDGVWQISTTGGIAPRWRRDGRELYYMTAYDRGKMTAVSIDTAGGAIRAGIPEELFSVDMAIVPHSTVVQNFHPYVVSPDGQRFLMPLPASTLSGENSSEAIIVVLNWTALLDP
jgi:eukaryotic-like serine/threonine-protein kinase